MIQPKRNARALVKERRYAIALTSGFRIASVSLVPSQVIPGPGSKFADAISVNNKIRGGTLSF